MPNVGYIGQPTFSFGRLKPIEMAFSMLSCVEWLLRLQPSVRDLAAPEHASFALMCHLKIRGRRECRALDAPAASHAK